MFFAIVAHLDLYCHQMDGKSTFLNGDLEQAVCMEQPEGIVDERHPDHVCKLRKALYGLNQAPRQWYAKINTFLIHTLGFQSFPYDPCLYTKSSNGMIVIISLYVDDLLLGYSDMNFLNWLKAEFSKDSKCRTVEKPAFSSDSRFGGIALRRYSM